MENKNEKFEYKYNAPTIEERKEINSIRSQYLPKDKTMTKIDRLRYLDKKVKTLPLIYSLSFGIGGTLTFGLGLTFFLEWSNYWYWGAPISIIGIVLAIIAYPLYNKLLNKYKNKYGKEIVELSNELLNEEENN